MHTCLGANAPLENVADTRLYAWTRIGKCKLNPTAILHDEVGLRSQCDGVSGAELFYSVFDEIGRNLFEVISVDVGDNLLP